MIYDLPDLNTFDGIISMPATMGSDATLRKIFEVMLPLKGKPHISIDVKQKNAVTIQFNDKNSVEELTEHMISRHGASRIMYVSGPVNSKVAMDRMEACSAVLKRHGLAIPLDEIVPARRLDIWAAGSTRLTAQEPECRFEYRILPTEAGKVPVTWEVTNAAGIVSPYVKIREENGQVTVRAEGDGHYYLRGLCGGTSLPPETPTATRSPDSMRPKS